MRQMVGRSTTGARVRLPLWATLAGAGTALLAVLAVAAPAGAAVEEAGEAIVVAGAGETRQRSEGGSATEFSLRLPDGASCPGDSANDNYRVQSYMVPSTVAPEAIQYDGLGPVSSSLGTHATFRQPLYEIGTSAFASAQTADAAAPGQPGPVVNIPSLSFAVFGPGELPPGRYHLGIACTLHNQPVRYWNTEVAVTVAPDDAPAQITWKLANPAGPARRSNGLMAVAVIGGVALAVTVAAVHARQRMRRQSPSDSTEVR